MITLGQSINVDNDVLVQEVLVSILFADIILSGMLMMWLLMDTIMGVDR